MNKSEHRIEGKQSNSTMIKSWIFVTNLLAFRAETVMSLQIMRAIKVRQKSSYFNKEEKSVTVRTQAAILISKGYSRRENDKMKRKTILEFLCRLIFQ